MDMRFGSNWAGQVFEKQPIGGSDGLAIGD